MDEISKFFFSYIHPEIGAPIFKLKKDLALCAVGIESSIWYNKEPKDLACNISKQMRAPWKENSKISNNRKKNYLLVLQKRLDILNVTSDTRNELLKKFEEVFTQKIINSSNSLPLETSIDLFDFEKLKICIEANGGSAKISEILWWIKNIK